MYPLTNVVFAFKVFFFLFFFYEMVLCLTVKTEIFKDIFQVLSYFVRARVKSKAKR